MRITPDNIHEQTFNTTFRGFDKVEVDNFLNQIADEMERLEEKISGLETDLELERSTKSQLEDLLGVARQLQTSIVDKAKEDARIVMNQAELVAERLTNEAREGVQDIRRDIQTLKDRKAALLAELSGLAHSIGQWVERIDEKETASDGDSELEPPVGEQRTTPLIRLAPENSGGAAGSAEEELEAEAFDLDDEAVTELAQTELAQREPDDTGGNGS